MKPLLLGHSREPYTKIDTSYCLVKGGLRFRKNNQDVCFCLSIVLWQNRLGMLLKSVGPFWRPIQILSKGHSFSFRRTRNLRDELVSGRFIEKRRGRNWLENVAPIGNFNCGNCSCCRYMQRGQLLTMGIVQHNVKDVITCRSDFVVYVISCIFTSVKPYDRYISE